MWSYSSSFSPEISYKCYFLVDLSYNPHRFYANIKITKNQGTGAISMKKFSAVLIGSGMRGEIYTSIMAKEPEKFEVIAVAEPVEKRRKAAQERHGIADENCFASWEDLLAKPKMNYHIDPSNQK